MLRGTNMLNRRQLTQFLLAAPFAPLAVRAQTPGEPVLRTTNGITVPGSNINLGLLPAAAAPNPAAYSALNVPGMKAGTAFSDPVTGTRTVKVTANGTPSSAQFCTVYATQGLQISQPWGPNRNQYTIAFINTGANVYLCDYTLGGTTTNYRAGPGGAGRVSFSRLAGQAQILYVQSGSQLSRYNTATNSTANTGIFPIAWATDSTPQCWLQLNQAETWATGINPSDNAVTAVNTTSGKVITQALAGIDEVYSGYNDVALINCDSGGHGPTAGYVWNLNTNTLTSLGLPFGNMGSISHVPSMRGFWIGTNTITGLGGMPLFRINEDGSHSQASTFRGYYGQWHACGHWKQSAGLDQYVLYSMLGGPENGWTPSLEYGLVFARCDNGSTAVLGHHYSVVPPASTESYWTQAHATQSNDGRIVLFGSNMLNGPRLDVFLMEVPVS
jgi:hypothetical protein